MHPSFTPTDIAATLASFEWPADMPAPMTRAARNGWALKFPNSPAVALEWEDDPAHIVFSTRLGTPEDARRTEVLETLMRCNALWDEVGGMRTALHAETGEFMLTLDWSPENVRLEDLPAMVLRVAALGAVWRAYVTASAAHVTDPRAPPDMAPRA